ncbi:hypothetical protein AB1L88_10865 [Tautonia sp. JC769]|uniref:hypothetical protein n=1 Tax=Tautonia sp. JC769 TaxID=3232135 RepID=UPI0034585CE0
MTGKWTIDLSSVAVWLVFAVVAFAVVAVREVLLVPRIGEPAAHGNGTLIAVGLMALVIVAFVRRVARSCSTLELVLIGVLWTAMTVAFEFGFFHLIMGEPLEELLADYNVLRGRLWVLVLATVLLGPVVVGLILRRGLTASIPERSSPADPGTSR